MILLFQQFDKLINILKKLKERNEIDKYYLSINQRNELFLLVVTNNVKINKDLFFTNELANDIMSYSQMTKKELLEDLFYFEKFEKVGNEIIEYQNSRRKLNNLLSPESDYIPELPVVSFYSYKGGMGRSTNLAITATHLARIYKRKIVIIDCDFEAPGFSNFFLEEPSELINKNGLIEYFFDKDSYGEINLNDYSWEVSKTFTNDGEIRIISAGNLDVDFSLNNSSFSTHLSHYLEGLARLDFASSNSMFERFRILVDDIQKQYQPDFIFIDNRTGFTDIFGIVALQLSSQIVGFFGNSAQNIPGIYQFLDSVISLVKSKKELQPPIIVNSFSKPRLFDNFKTRVNNYIEKIDNNDDDFQLTPDYFYFRYDNDLSELGTIDEDKDTWLSRVDNKSFYIGYGDLSERLNDSLSSGSVKDRTIEEPLVVEEISDYNNEKDINIENTNTAQIEFSDIQKRVLTSILSNWPQLYADSDEVDYQKEYDQERIFYRDSMKDIFNFNKFIVLGNKGTGKSYIFQALKNEDITNELKKRAQKSNQRIEFLHLVDKKEHYFISTNALDSFKSEITQIGDFYPKFWKVYTWKSIVEKIYLVVPDFNSTIDASFSIKNSDTDNLKKLIAFISNIENIILVEKELKELDAFLNSRQVDIIGIYDNLDLMVEPIRWKDEISPLINFWQFSDLKRIHGKLFLRSDLFKNVRGINNIQSLKNNVIIIEWQKEEIFNYFFNIVKRYANDDFLFAVNSYDFKSASKDAIEWKDDFVKKFKTPKQTNFDEHILRKLCWVFFGQYPDIKAHGESYDWLYKNVMNADETISIRPFLDLLSLSIKKYNSFVEKDTSAILPERYYTDKLVRGEAVDNHIQDLVTERGNENLKLIFDFIDKNTDYQYYNLKRKDLYEMLEKVISKNSLSATVQELEDLMIINGVIKQVGTHKYSYAFLYKYKLGLRNKY